MSPFRRSLIIFTFLSLGACNVPDPKKRDAGESAATFYFDAFEGKVISTKLGGTFALPQEKTYSMMVCLKDKRYSKPIVSNKFTLEDPEESFVSDAQGCVKWTEKVEYNFFAQSQYVLRERKISGFGYHSGTITLKIALNPMAHGEDLDEAFELSLKSMDKVIDDEKVLSLGKSRPLWLSSLNISNTKTELEDKKIANTYDIQGRPQILLAKRNGEAVLFDIKEGKFKAEFKFLLTNTNPNDQGKTVIGEGEISEVLMKAAQISFSSRVIFPAGLPDRGEIIFAFKLIPLDAPPELQAFEGIYPMGPATSLRSKQMHLNLAEEVINNPQMKISEVITSEAPLKKEFEPGKTGLQWQTDALNSRLQQPTLVNEQMYKVGDKYYTAYNLRHYEWTLCLFQSVTEPLRSIPVNVSGDDVQAMILHTDNTGCLKVPLKVIYNRTGCQEYVKKNIRFIQKEFGKDLSLAYYFHPFYGKIYPEDQFSEALKANNCSKKLLGGVPLLKLDQIDLRIVGSKYEFDRFMRLNRRDRREIKVKNVKWTAQLSADEKHNELHNVNNGPYYVRIAFFRSGTSHWDLTGSRLLSHAEGILNAKGGDLIGDLVFEPINDGPGANRPALVYLEILPMNSDQFVLTENRWEPPQDKTLEDLITKPNLFKKEIYVGKISSLQSNLESLSVYPETLENLTHTAEKLKIEKDKDVTHLSTFIESQKRLAEMDIAPLESASSFENLARQQNLVLIRPGSSSEELIDGFWRALAPVSRQQNAQRISPSDWGYLISNYFGTAGVEQVLCDYWFKNFVTNDLKDPTKAVEMARNCKFRASYRAKLPESPSMTNFNIGAYFRPGNAVETRPISQGLKKTGLTVSSGIGFRKWYDKGHSFNHAFSAAIEAAGGRRLGDKWHIGVGLEAAYSPSLNYMEGELNLKERSEGLSESSSLAVTEEVFQLSLDQLEMCVVVNLNSSVVRSDFKALGSKKIGNLLNQAREALGTWNFLGDLDDKDEDFHLSLADELKETYDTAERIKVASRGLLLCTGTLVKMDPPYRINDSIFTFTQDAKSQQVTQIDSNNTNFIYQVRGSRDYENFKIAIAEKLSLPATYQNISSKDDSLERILKSIYSLSEPKSSVPGFIFKEISSRQDRGSTTAPAEKK